MNKDYLSKEQTTCIKGILCVLVLLSHCLGSTYFHFMGAWTVSTFFFLSGFAMELKSGKESVNFKVVLKRILSLIMPVILCEIFYHFVYSRTGFGQYNSVSAVIDGIVSFNPVVNVSWYVEMLVILTVFYSLMNWTFKDNMKKKALGFSALYLILGIYVITMTTHHFVLKNAHFFLIGILFCHYRESVERFFCNHKIVLWGLFATSVVAFVLPLVSDVVPAPWSIILITIFDNTGVIFMLGLSLIIKLKSRILTWLGKVSLWIYLLHIAFLLWIHFDLTPKFKVFGYLPRLIWVMLFTFVSAAVLDWIYKHTFRRIIDKI